ncbi:hypothetical protein H5410_053156 [Solanum commersonii]|uniref:Uncharacterized protein n=1 Tax=Solanum commersonii TaxID=4109 RepID=A0A9J5X2S0_SOLCO|nr:hypothetical protein H5410_053156 [Solanum commersonii]
MNIAKSLGVRKGSWTKEEDIILRKCIDKYGEGKWHLVPSRAGLNRCRKSCRLRWSLIAGRLPGRTANDVKNYWNTHLHKKLITPPPQIQENKYNNTLKITESTILRPRPRPRTFSSANNISWCTNNSMITNTLCKDDEQRNKEIVVNICEKPTRETTSSSIDNDGVKWWTDLLENWKEFEEEAAAVLSFEEENKLLPNLFVTHIMNTPMCTSLGVRKGSWTEEEDFHLRKCIQKYGEGKWHLVPSRAGLNRCRKSCRLRWLNYLRPHIKRGRTANDVKNYWNTNLLRKLNTNITKNEIIKPQPRTLSSNAKNVSWCNDKSMITNTLDKDDEQRNKELVVNICEKPMGETTTLSSPIDDDGVEWWTSLLENCNEVEDEEAVLLSFEEENKLLPNLLHEENNSPIMLQGESDGWDIDLLGNLLN